MEISNLIVESVLDSIKNSGKEKDEVELMLQDLIDMGLLYEEEVQQIRDKLDEVLTQPEFTEPDFTEGEPEPGLDIEQEPEQESQPFPEEPEVGEDFGKFSAAWGRHSIEALVWQEVLKKSKRMYGIKNEKELGKFLKEHPDKLDEMLKLIKEIREELMSEIIPPQPKEEITF